MKKVIKRFIGSYLRAAAAVVSGVSLVGAIGAATIPYLAQLGIALAAAGIAPLAKLLADMANVIDPEA